MQKYMRLLADRQTTVITVPSLDFNSLHCESLRLLGLFFEHAAECVFGTTVILDVTAVKSAGAAFLTEVNRLAMALTAKQIQIVVAGDPGGIFRRAGWMRRFPSYTDLVAAVSAPEKRHLLRRVARSRVQSGPCRAQSRENQETFSLVSWLRK